MSVNKIMYIGAGLHLSTLAHFPELREFVFVDTLPRSEFDHANANKFVEIFYSHTFVERLKVKCQDLGFQYMASEETDIGYYSKIMNVYQRCKWFGCIKQIFPHICPTLFVFANPETNQVLKYYMSTDIFLNMSHILRADLQTCDGLIISGYHPSQVLLRYVDLPITLFCYSKTAYDIPPEEVDDEDNIVLWLFQNKPFVKMFFDRIFVCDMDGVKTECSDVTDMNTLANAIHLEDMVKMEAMETRA